MELLVLLCRRHTLFLLPLLSALAALPHPPSGFNTTVVLETGAWRRSYTLFSGHDSSDILPSLVNFLSGEGHGVVGLGEVLLEHMSNGGLARGETLVAVELLG
ncbi:unnamed protein product, partial [Discosporangium mesarthrocarpum]